MPEWWTYSLEDFLLFSPRVYWRLFERHNEALWPLHVPALLLGAAILAGIARPRPWSDRAIPAVLAAAWIWVAWSFLWDRYATINWAVVHAVPAFAFEALLLGWLGLMRGGLRFVVGRTIPDLLGLSLVLYALLLHPLLPQLAGRPIQAAEVFGIAPDPTAIATLGLVSLGARGGAAWLLLLVPLAWCLASWATLHAMGAPEAWIPLAAAGLALVSRTPRRRRPA